MARELGELGLPTTAAKVTAGTPNSSRCRFSHMVDFAFLCVSDAHHSRHSPMDVCVVLTLRRCWSLTDFEQVI